MFKVSTIAVDPQLTVSSKLRSVLRANPAPQTAYKRHSRLLIQVAETLYEARVYNIADNPDAAIYRVIDRHYID